MRLNQFLKMYRAQIITHIVFLGLIEILLFIFGVNHFLMIYLLMIGIILEVIYLCQQVMKKFRYYKDINYKLSILDQKCMLSEMLECPHFAEGEILYDILKECKEFDQQ